MLLRWGKAQGRGCSGGRRGGAPAPWPRACSRSRPRRRLPAAASTATTEPPTTPARTRPPPTTPRRRVATAPRPPRRRGPDATTATRGAAPWGSARDGRRRRGRPPLHDRTEVTDTQYATFRAKLDAPGLAASPRGFRPCDRTALVAIDREGALSDRGRIRVPQRRGLARRRATALRRADGGRSCSTAARTSPLEWEVACATTRHDATRGARRRGPPPAGCQTGLRTVEAPSAPRRLRRDGGPRHDRERLEYVNVRRDSRRTRTPARAGSPAGRTVGNGCETHGSASGARGRPRPRPCRRGLPLLADVRP